MLNCMQTNTTYFMCRNPFFFFFLKHGVLDQSDQINYIFLKKKKHEG